MQLPQLGLSFTAAPSHAHFAESCGVAVGDLLDIYAGGVNGAAQALVALLRGLAPFLGGYFWSLSVSSSMSHSQFIVFSFDVLWALASFVLYEHIKG